MDTRQKVADLCLSNQPQHMLLYYDATVILVANTDNKLLLYFTRNATPSRDELALFEQPILSLTRGEKEQDLYVMLESGALLQVHIVSDLKGFSQQSQDNKNAKDSSCCVIL